jgi:nucleotide-binding universal stress UspA family protein
MKKILCATRGGEASIRAQDAAIALAKEQKAELWFMYVVDIGFMDKSLYAMRPDVVKGEMENLGEFLLAMAQERARQQGVSAEYLLRHGDLRQELIDTARDGGMDLVVLGKPAGEQSAFALDALEGFASEIEAEAGVSVKIV